MPEWRLYLVLDVSGFFSANEISESSVKSQIFLLIHAQKWINCNYTSLCCIIREESSKETNLLAENFQGINLFMKQLLLS